MIGNGSRHFVDIAKLAEGFRDVTPEEFERQLEIAPGSKYTPRHLITFPMATRKCGCCSTPTYWPPVSSAPRSAGTHRLHNSGFAGWKSEFDLLISEQVMSELSTTLDLPWFAARVDPSNRNWPSCRLHDRSGNGRCLQRKSSGVASHWQDDLVLSAAVSGNADYLVTGDAEFRRVDEYQGVKIRTPAEFLIELDEHPG